MAAGPDAPCSTKNISLISSTRPCDRSTGRTSPYTLQATAAFAVAITFMMTVTIVGNILVIIAVLTSRSLKGAQNLYLVSLAAADILVATLIIPFSLANELQGYWAFSAIWCEVYLALDVLFCTSSIVHLCAIALDRYLSISRPVSYGAKRSPSRIKAGIMVVWLISAVISFPPLLSLDKSEGGEEVCELNSERWYILYSTIGSFFAPCVIMVLVYVRIYQIAKQHARSLPGQKENASSRVASGEPVMKLSEQPQLTREREEEQNTTTSSSLQNPHDSKKTQLHPAPAQTLLSSSSSVPRSDSQIFTATSQEHPAESRDELPDHTSSSGSELDVGGEGFVGEDDKGEKKKTAEQTLERRQSKGSRVQEVNLSSRYRSTLMTSSGTKLVPEGAAAIQGTSGASRRKALVNREKRFTFVLAVVMGAFVICWFPFFFSYSLQAVCPESCSIPHPLFKFFFWSGYCNSCLNPIIYTIFNKDFRKAFKRILCRDVKGTSF